MLEGLDWEKLRPNCWHAALRPRSPAAGTRTGDAEGAEEQLTKRARLRELSVGREDVYPRS